MKIAIALTLFVCSLSAQTVAITSAPPLVPVACQASLLQSCGPTYKITVTGIEGAPAALRYAVTAQLAGGGTFVAAGIVPVPIGKRQPVAFATFQLPEPAASFTWRIDYLGVVATFVGQAAQ